MVVMDECFPARSYDGIKFVISIMEKYGKIPTKISADPWNCIGLDIGVEN
jgi:hypothetical protein